MSQQGVRKSEIDREPVKPEEQYVAEDPHNFGKINGVETEWTQLQRKFGNLRPKTPEEPELPDPTAKEVAHLIAKTTHELKDDGELRDAYEDIDDEEEKQMLLEIRRKRLQEMKKAAARKKFGIVKTIRKIDYVDEVTKASEGINVICLLFAGTRECEKMTECLTKLAQKVLTTKFVRIEGSQAIDNYPKENCPTLLYYKSGKMQCAPMVGIKQFGGMYNMTPESLEWKLSKIGAVESKLKHNPLEAPKEYKVAGGGSNFVQNRYRGMNRYGSDDESDSEDEYN
mmetsp:Transcript_2736/g.3935  ORF Transcript_2736/g.3935 Transcript_2736/m.3935 type:complete len:284 (+) Transcript_2736:138-989(+)